jgi:cell wall-associated NlpC family hydrolase
MTAWYNKYTNAPYKHLGQDLVKGIDCFNLCSLVLKQECGISVGLSTMDFCNIIDDDWYLKTNEPLIENATKLNYPNFSWLLVEEAKPFDILTMSIGSTNITNHCAMYIGDNKLLQTMIGRSSWVSTYGKYYKQYTLGIYRWNGLNS